MTQGFTKGVPIDTDPTLAANSDQLVCSQKAIKTYVDVTIAGDALPVTATSNQVLQSVSLAAPVWSTATYPSTATSTGSILYANGTNYVASTSLWPNTVGTAGKVLRSDGTTNAYSTSTFSDTYTALSVLTASTANSVASIALTAAQVVTNRAGALEAATITAGTNVTISQTANAITINASGGSVVATIAGTSQSAAVNTTYIALNAGQTTVTLPATFAVGETVSLIGSLANTGGWILTASTGDTIRVNNSTTSAGGTVTSAAIAGQCIDLICDVADTSWIMKSNVSTTLTTA